MRGVDRLEGMLSMMAVAVPRLAVDPAVGRRTLSGGPLATDEVMRRVEDWTGLPLGLSRSRRGDS